VCRPSLSGSSVVEKNPRPADDHLRRGLGRLCHRHRLLPQALISGVRPTLASFSLARGQERTASLGAALPARPCHHEPISVVKRDRDHRAWSQRYLCPRPALQGARVRSRAATGSLNIAPASSTATSGSSTTRSPPRWARPCCTRRRSCGMRRTSRGSRGSGWRAGTGSPTWSPTHGETMRRLAADNMVVKDPRFLFRCRWGSRLAPRSSTS